MGFLLNSLLLFAEHFKKHDVLQSQAKLLAEQKRFPFATDNDNTNEELGKMPYVRFVQVNYVLIISTECFETKLMIP